MKKLLMFIALIACMLAAPAQTKKSTTTKKPATTAKKSTTTKKSTATTTKKSTTTAKKSTAPATKKSTAPATKKSTTSSNQKRSTTSAGSNTTTVESTPRSSQREEKPVTVRRSSHSTPVYSEPEPERVFRPMGYRGFFEHGVGYETHYEAIYAHITTTHGFEINPRLFVGAGLGLDYCPERETAMASAFADFRFCFLKSRITPYLDFKGGAFYYSDAEATGVMLNPSLGCHFSFAPRFAMNVSLGVDYRAYTYEVYSSYSHCYEEYTKELPTVKLMVGIEW